MTGGCIVAPWWERQCAGQVVMVSPSPLPSPLNPPAFFRLTLYVHTLNGWEGKVLYLIFATVQRLCSYIVQATLLCYTCDITKYYTSHFAQYWVLRQKSSLSLMNQRFWCTDLCLVFIPSLHH